MNFQEFVNLTRPVIGGKSSSHKFVRTLFDAILSDDGRDILDDYSENTYKAYANGRTQITNIAKAISPHIDPVEFATFIYQAGESAQLELCERFISYLPSIDARNVGEELADLFADIIREAAGTKRKSAPKDAKTGTNESAYDASFGASVNPSTLSAEDLSRLKEFREESRDILKYIIKNDPSAGPTEITLSNEISGLIKKWQFSVREIENSTFRKLVLDILNQLREYTYYISEVFLRYIPGRDILCSVMNQGKKETAREMSFSRNLMSCAVRLPDFMRCCILSQKIQHRTNQKLSRRRLWMTKSHQVPPRKTRKLLLFSSRLMSSRTERTILI